jgi:hypothetical protein
MKNDILHIVPAEAGWRVVYPVFEDDVARALSFEPVIAWQVVSNHGADVEFFSIAEPITASGTCGSGDWALRDPDGNLSSPMVEDYASETELLASFTDDHKARIARVRRQEAK